MFERRLFHALFAAKIKRRHGRLREQSCKRHQCVPVFEAIIAVFFGRIAQLVKSAAFIMLMSKVRVPLRPPHTTHSEATTVVFSDRSRLPSCVFSPWIPSRPLHDPTAPTKSLHQNLWLPG